jgi:hypothetical protein
MTLTRVVQKRAGSQKAIQEEQLLLIVEMEVHKREIEQDVIHYAEDGNVK